VAGGGGAVPRAGAGGRRVKGAPLPCRPFTSPLLLVYGLALHCTPLAHLGLCSSLLLFIQSQTDMQHESLRRSKRRCNGLRLPQKPLGSGSGTPPPYLLPIQPSSRSVNARCQCIFDPL
jgi:hypothetical protein